MAFEGWLGGSWTGNLFFCKRPSNKFVELKAHQMKHYFKELNADKDIIVAVEILKFPLLGPITATMGLWHEYVVVETENYYWSFEKIKKGIYVQRSKKKEKVSLYHGSEERNKPGPEGRQSEVSNRGTIMQIMKRMLRRKELEETYHIFDSNCQKYASVLYEAITKTEGRSLHNNN